LGAEAGSTSQQGVLRVRSLGCGEVEHAVDAVLAFHGEHDYGVKLGDVEAAIRIEAGFLEAPAA
jgi:hypothetical protein